MTRQPRLTGPAVTVTTATRRNRLGRRQQAPVAVLVTPGGPSTIAALTRRHRRQLAPLALLAVVLVVAANPPHRPVTLAASTGLATGAAMALAARTRHSPRWAAAWTAWTWTTVAAHSAHGGLGRPWPTSWTLLAWATLTIAWWMRHRTHGPATVPPAAVAQQWAEHVGGDGQALDGTYLVDVHPIDGGVSAEIQLIPGQMTTSDAVAATERVTSALQLPMGSVVIEAPPSGIASRARLLVLHDNPLYGVQDWRGCQLDPTTGTFPTGRYADGTQACWRFWRPESGAVHGLISGTTGAGKSSTANVILAEARHCGLIVPWAIDNKHGQSFPDWVDAVDWFAGDPKAAIVMLRAARRILDARVQHLARVPWTDAHGRARTGLAHFTPTPQMPLLLITIDEAQELLQHTEAVALVEALTTMGRSAGICLILLTQVPLLTNLGNSMTIRDMLAGGNVMVFRTANRLGGHLAFNGALAVNPAALPRAHPGMAYTLGDEDRAAPMRTYRMADPYDAAHTGTPAVLDVLSIAAAGADYQHRGTEQPAPAGPAELLTAPGPANARDAVLAAIVGLSEVSDVVTPAQIFAALSQQPRTYDVRTVTNVLTALDRDGLIARVARGKYKLLETAR